MNMKKLNVTLAILVAAVMAGNAQTSVTSDIVGYTKLEFPTGTSGHGVGFVKEDSFRGTPTILTSTTMTFSGASFGSLGPTADGLPKYYVEIANGNLAGYNADIISNTSTVLTISADFSSLTTLPTIVIREHIRASNIFANASGMEDFVDTLVVNNPDGSQTSLLRDSNSATGWIDAGTFSAADLIVYPGQAFLLNTAGPGNFTFSGKVKTTPTAVPLYAASGNFVSYSHPSASPSLQNINLGTNLTLSEEYICTAGTFSTDGALTQNATFLFADASTGFIDPGTFAAPDQDTIEGLASLIVNVSSDQVWIIPSPVN
jgi:hypothetical protein